MALVALAVPAHFLLERPELQPEFQGLPDDLGATPAFRFQSGVYSLQEGFINTKRYCRCHAELAHSLSWSVGESVEDPAGGGADVPQVLDHLDAGVSERDDFGFGRADTARDNGAGMAEAYPGPGIAT